MAFCRFFMLAKQAAYAREAWCICTRFACTGTGRCPDASGNAAKRQRYCCDSNKDIRRRRQKSTRSVLPRQWHASHARESSRKGDGFILFASAKRTKKQTGLRPATSVQIAGRDDVLDKMTGFHQVTDYVRTAILHSIDGNDLNRCELQA